MGIVVDDKPAGPPKVYPVASEGVALVVLADVEDLGVQQNQFYGARREVRLTWVVNEKDPEGNYFVISRKYTASLHEKSNLFGDVKDMIGRTPPTSLDIETLIGTVNSGVIKQVDGKDKNEGKKFANIKAFLAPRAGEMFAIPKDFVRGKDGGKFGRAQQQRGSSTQTRTAANVQTAATRQAPAQEVADEDIPF